MKVIIENAVKRDLVIGKAPYIRKGNLYFDTVSFDCSNKEFFISHKNKILVRWSTGLEAVQTKVNDIPLGIISLKLTEGKMKIKVI